MKKIIVPLLHCFIAKTIIMALVFFIFSSGKVYAFFSSQGRITNTSFTTGVWAPPTAPELKNPRDNLETNQDQVFEWYTPALVYFWPVSYTLEFYNADPTPLNTWQIVHSYFGLLSERYPPNNPLFLVDGTYFWRVKAFDGINQESVWSEVRKIVVDKTPPQTVIKVENGGVHEMNEQIDDGTFEKYSQTLQNSNFTIAGNVFLWENDDSYQTIAHEGNRMIRIGHMVNQLEGVDLTQNKLSYSFASNSKNISFYYNFFSSDEYPFDDPSFVFAINGNPVFDMGAGDVAGNTLVKSSGWQQFYLDISNLAGNVILDFYAGNNLDNYRQSWVYLDEIKTGKTVVNNQTKFSLTANEDGASYYCFDQCGDNETWTQYQNPSAVASGTGDGDHTLYFRTIDRLGNKENPQIKNIYIDNTPPSQIVDLAVKEIKSEMASFVFTAPAEIDGYDIRISDEQNKLIDQWETTQKLNLGLVPSAAGTLEEFTVNNLESNKTYYLAIKSFDAAVNYSGISNIVQFKTALKKGDILIQEVLYDAANLLGEDEEDYEWIKLYNQTNEQINLDNWYIQDNNKKNILHGAISTKNFLLITPSITSFAAKYPSYSGPILQISENEIGNGLANGGDYIKLFDQNDFRWDEVGWKTDNTIWPNCQLKASTGKSLVRKTLGVDTDLETDWTVNVNPLFPFPAL